MQYYYYAFFCPKNQTPKECEHFFGPKIKLLKSLHAFFLAPKNQTPKKFEGYDDRGLVIIAEKIYCKRGMFIFSANSLPSYPHESPKFVNIKLM